MVTKKAGYKACFGRTTNQNKGCFMKPAKHKFSLLIQVLSLIPAYLISKLS